MTDPGILFIVAAASGTGKTSLVNRLLEQDPQIQVSISYTTRPKRPGEQDGVNYFFISIDQFKQLEKDGEFFESALVHGNYYGTSKSFVQKKLQEGVDLILEIDWQGAAQIRSLFKEQQVSIFILPPSIQTLEQRLTARQQDSESTIHQRIAGAAEEIRHCQEFDYLLVNADFDETIGELHAIVLAERQKTPRALRRYQNILQQL